MSDTFLGLPSVDPAALAAGDADAVVLGVPFGVPYPTPGPAAGCAEAPAAIRARSQRLARFATHHDFDLDGPMLPPGSTYRVADAGDVPGSAEDGAGNAAATEAVVRQLLGAGAVPLLLGGDDSVPIPFLRAYADHGPITVVQVDAHLDFRDERAGVRDGYSSAMRRASEMGHVERIVQVGLRGVGSARPVRRGRCPRRGQPAGHRPRARRARRAVAAGAAAGRRSRWWSASTWTGWIRRWRRR